MSLFLLLLLAALPFSLVSPRFVTLPAVSGPLHAHSFPLPSAINPSALRRLASGAVELQHNDSAGVLSTVRRWTAAEVEAVFRNRVGDGEYEEQQDRLDQWTQLLEATLSAEASSGTAPPASLSGRASSASSQQGSAFADLFFLHLHQAQCRGCVQHNLALLLSNDTGAPADYQPIAVMKWCSSARASGAPSNDWDGHCVSASTACPTSTVDLNILSATTCPTDDPTRKESCSECVADGYTWQTSQRAIDTGDSEEGRCVDAAVASVSTLMQHSDWQRMVFTLDGCPYVLYSAGQARMSATSRVKEGNTGAQVRGSAPWTNTNITGLPWTRYQALTKEQKQARLWNATTALLYSKDGYPNDTLSLLVAGRVLLPWYPSESFLWPSDELPADRTGIKVFHTYGSAGTGEVTIDADSIFSGLLGSDGVHNISYPVFIRLSQAAPGQNVYGIAVKWLIDGLPSENLVAMHALDVQPSSYFFYTEFQTIISEPQTTPLQVLAAILRTSQVLSIPADELPATAETIPMDRLSRVHANGTRPDAISTPFKLFFVPTDEVRQIVDPADTRDFRLILGDIPAGTALYRIYGCPSSNGCANSTDTNSHYVGVLKVTSELVVGPYGDEQLFFQHPTAVNSQLGGGCPFAASAVSQ